MESHDGLFNAQDQKGFRSPGWLLTHKMDATVLCLCVVLCECAVIGYTILYMLKTFSDIGLIFLVSLRKMLLYVGAALLSSD